MTPAATLNLIRQFGGRIFAVQFVRRTDGQIRDMLCRRGVNFGREPSTDRERQDREHGLLTVYDMQKGAYRCIPLDAVLSIAGTPQETRP